MNLPDKSNRFPQMVRHMSCRDDLIALRDAVQTGDFVNFRIIAKVLVSEARDIGQLWPSHDAQKAMSGSVDAALAFFAAMLPGWRIEEMHQKWGGTWYANIERKNDLAICTATAETPALALLIATLNALIAEADKADAAMERIWEDE